MKKDSEMVEQTKNLRADNEAQKQEYANQADIAQQKVEEADAAQKQAEELVQQYQNEVDSLDSQVAELLAEEEAAAQKAAEEAAAAAAQAEAASSTNNASSDSGSSNNSASNGGGSSNNASSNSGESNNNDSSNGGGSSSGGNSSSGGGSNNYGGSVVAAAQSQLGVPYVWGGTAWGSGLDCSGLTSGCWSRAAAFGLVVRHGIRSLPPSGRARFLRLRRATCTHAAAMWQLLRAVADTFMPRSRAKWCATARFRGTTPSTAPCVGTKRELKGIDPGRCLFR